MSTPPGSPRASHHLLSITLAGIPELQLFESEEQRNRALGEMAVEAGNVRSPWFWGIILALPIAVVIVVRLTKWGLNYVGATGMLREAILLIVGLGAFLLLVRAIHRAGVRKELRRKLLAFGVPVCFRCGYSLRGLPVASGRCPECGRAFEPRVRELLVAAHENARATADGRVGAAPGE